MKSVVSFPLTHFSLSAAHWAGGGGGGRRLMERATWTNPVWNQDGPTQPDLWPCTALFPHRGPSRASEYSFSVTSVYFSFLPYILIHLFSISSFSFCKLVSLTLLLFPPTSWADVHSDICLQLHCSCRGRSHGLQRGELSQHFCLLSLKHCDPSITLTTTTCLVCATHTQLSRGGKTPSTKTHTHLKELSHMKGQWNYILLL